MKEDQITGLGFKFDKECTHGEGSQEGYIVKPTLKTIALLSQINFVL